MTLPAHTFAAPRYIRDISFKFITADVVAADWYRLENQTMPEREWCLDHLKPGDTVIDCGAHHGMMTVIFAKAVGGSGTVVAYEALPENADVIEQNARANGLANIQVRPVGIYDREGVVSFDRNSRNVVLTHAAAVGGISVVRLDDDLPEHVRVNFLKMDVEGSEVQAMNGARRILSQRPIIDLELHNFVFQDRAASISAMIGLLDPLSYRYTVLPEIWAKFEDETDNLDLAWLAQFDNPHVFCTPT
jgi:FkbM family methyltransferase